MSTLSLKLPERLLATLDRVARERRTTKSAVVREFLEQTLSAPKADREASCYDLAHDLAGSLKGLPRDLATHPPHTCGFRRCRPRSLPPNRRWAPCPTAPRPLPWYATYGKN